MRLLLDINVILDVLLDREPWVLEAALLLSAVDAGQAQGLVAGHTVTTVHYLVRARHPRAEAAAAVARLLDMVDVVPVGRDELLAALDLDLDDFEDGVQAACALAAGAEVVVTRNARDFHGIGIPAGPPGAVLARLG